MTGGSSSGRVEPEPAHSRLENGRTLERISFRATDEQLAAIDGLVEDDVYHSRSEAIRAGLEALLERHERAGDRDGR